MKQYGIDPELARKEIESNKHSNTTTTYYLLMKKLKKSLFTKIYEFPSQLKYEMAKKPQIDSSVLNNYSPKPQLEDEMSDAGSVISSRTDQLPQDNSIVNQIMEESK